MADLSPPSPAGATPLDGAFASLRGMGVRRNPDDRWLAGVCSGVADRLGIDPLVVRGALIVLLFVGGLGGLAYLVAWALIPARDGRILAEEALHGHGWSITLLVVIGIALVSNVADRWWLWLVLVPVGLFGWWAVRSARAGKTPDQMAEELRGHADRVAGAFSPSQRESHLPTPAPESSVPTPALPTPAPPTLESPTLEPAASSPTPGYAASRALPVPGSAPHALGPGRSGVVVAPPRVVRRHRRGGGLLALLLTAGLAVAGYGLGSLLATGRAWPGSHELVGGAFAVAGAGLALVLVGLSGRRAGLSVVLTATLAAAVVLATGLPHVPTGGFGERTWLASAPPAGGFALTAGEARLSLADAPPGVPVRVAMGAGELTVRVPMGTTVDLDATIYVGQVSLRRLAGQQDLDGRVGAPETITTSVGSGPTHIPLVVRLGAGEIILIEESG